MNIYYDEDYYGYLLSTVNLWGMKYMGNLSFEQNGNEVIVGIMLQVA